MFEQLKKELLEAGYGYMSLESLQDVKDGKVKLSHQAHEEFNDFMDKGAKLFG